MTLTAARTLRRVTAYHEAAHAVLAIKCGKHVLRVALSDDDPQSGVTIWASTQPQPGISSYRPGSITRAWVRSLASCEQHIQILLAGPLAEARLLDMPMRSLGARADLQHAEALHRHLEKLHDCLSQHVALRWPYRNRYLNHLRQRARQLIALPEIWVHVEAIAAALVIHRELTGSEVANIMQRIHARDGQLGLQMTFENPVEGHGEPTDPCAAQRTVRAA